jgi:hypothetical protein
MLNAIGINPIVSFDTANALYISGWVLTSYLFDCPQNSRTFLYFHSLNVSIFCLTLHAGPLPEHQYRDYTLQECPGSPLALGSTADDALTATQKGGDFHALHSSRRPPIARLRIERLDQRAQRRLRHHSLHFSQKRRPPRRLGIALKLH